MSVQSCCRGVMSRSAPEGPEMGHLKSAPMLRRQCMRVTAMIHGTQSPEHRLTTGERIRSCARHGVRACRKPMTMAG